MRFSPCSKRRTFEDPAENAGEAEQKRLEIRQQSKKTIVETGNARATATRRGVEATRSRSRTPKLEAEAGELVVGNDADEIAGAHADAAVGQAHMRAGQAVVCVTLFGARVVKHLEITEDSESEAGFETYSRLPVPLTSRPNSNRRGDERKPIAVEAIVDAHGVLAYAGIAAAHAWLATRGEAEQPDPRSANLAAREALSKLASSIGVERPSDHFYDEYFEEAVRLLEGQWPVVQRVVEGLLTHQSLNGNRVDALIVGEELGGS